MPLQTSYAQYQPAGAVGALVNGEEFNAFSRIATATIAFGAPVQRSGDINCAPFADGGEFIGIARRSLTVSNGADQFVQYNTVGCIDEGVIWGIADAAITVGTALKFNVTTGRYTTAAASGTVVVVPGLESDSAASGAGVLFKMRLRRVPS